MSSATQCQVFSVTADRSSFLDRCDAYMRTLGLFARSGLKFGCDFLVYRTPDCNESHATFMAICSEGPVDTETLLTLGRIAGAVGKQVAIVTEIDGAMQFIALTRAVGVV